MCRWDNSQPARVPDWVQQLLTSWLRFGNRWTHRN